MPDLDSKESPAEIKKWVQARIAAVEEVYTAYDALTEAGVELNDRYTDMQVSCPLPAHGPDARPSARYYGSSTKPHFFCFKEKESHNGISLYASLKGIRFMDALQELERRFHIKILKHPDGPAITEPADRDSTYVSNQWNDVPRMLAYLEKKLARLKPRCGFSDYVKFCRVLDAVSWDFDKSGKASPAMADILKKLMAKMDEVPNDDINNSR
jgi:hypothetical protein